MEKEKTKGLIGDLFYSDLRMTYEKLCKNTGESEMKVDNPTSRRTLAPPKQYLDCLMVTSA